MAVIENQLNFRRKDFSADSTQHQTNLRELEVWASTPADFLVLADQVSLPSTSEMEVGTIVRTGDSLYFLKSTGWTLIV